MAKITINQHPTLEIFLADLSNSMNFSDEMLQYLEVSLDTYIGSLPASQQKEFIRALPEFIEVDTSVEQPQALSRSISNFKELAKESLRSRKSDLPEDNINTEKFMLNTVIMFHVLQKYMAPSYNIDLLNSNLGSSKIRIV